MCDGCVAGLDADLLAVIPAFSRHPSLKHLMLGKNFNIKGRYGARGESTAQMVVIMMTNVFLLLSVSSGCWMKHCRNWFIWCKRKIVWVELCNILWDTHLHMYESPGGVLHRHRRTPTRTLYAARSHADALLSHFKFVRPVCVYLTRISHLPQTVGANMLSLWTCGMIHLVSVYLQGSRGALLLCMSSMTSSLLNYLLLLMVIAHSYVLTLPTESQMGVNMQIRSKYTGFVN